MKFRKTDFSVFTTHKLTQCVCSCRLLRYHYLHLVFLCKHLNNPRARCLYFVRKLRSSYKAEIWKEIKKYAERRQHKHVLTICILHTTLSRQVRQTVSRSEEIRQRHYEKALSQSSAGPREGQFEVLWNANSHAECTVNYCTLPTRNRRAHLCAETKRNGLK